jgi:8-amino-7-oxononanoate synthase
MLSEQDFSKLKICTLIALLRAELSQLEGVHLTPSTSAIQGLIVPGAARCRAVAQQVWEDGFDVRPIVAPTVARGSERIRICLHEFNTEEEILSLVGSLKRAISSTGKQL